MQMPLIPLDRLSSPPVHDEIFCCSQVERQSSFAGSPLPPDTSLRWWINPRRRILQFWNHFALSWLSAHSLLARRQGGREQNIKCQQGGSGGGDGCQTCCKLNNNGRNHLETWQRQTCNTYLPKFREKTWRIKSVNPATLQQFLSC